MNVNYSADGNLQEFAVIMTVRRNSTQLAILTLLCWHLFAGLKPGASIRSFDNARKVAAQYLLADLLLSRN